MRNGFDFLFYCLYRMFSALRKSNRVENSASIESIESLTTWVYTLLLSTNTIMLLFPLKFIIPEGSLDPPLLKYSVQILLASVFVGWYFFCRNYFLNNGHYREIDSRYDESNGNSRKPLTIGIVYSLLTPISFITTATYI